MRSAMEEFESGSGSAPVVSEFHAERPAKADAREDDLETLLAQISSPTQRKVFIQSTMNNVTKGDERILGALARLVSDGKESIMVREAGIVAITVISNKDNEQVLEALLGVAQRDKVHSVRKLALQALSLVPSRRGGRDISPTGQRVLSEALSLLEKKELRGQPLFKPNGDPLSLSAEALAIVGVLAPQGEGAAWLTLERRALDDPAPAARLAAVRSLAHIADPAILASGGRRFTVHLLALGMCSSSATYAAACRDSLAALLDTPPPTLYYG